MNTSSNKHIAKILFKLLEVRGFENPTLVIQWNEFHQDAQNFFPVRLQKTNKEYHILYIMAKNKISAVGFPYVKQNLLQALHARGFGSISEICLSNGKKL